MPGRVPKRYLAFARERMRPALDLLTRIPQWPTACPPPPVYHDDVYAFPVYSGWLQVRWHRSRRGVHTSDRAQRWGGGVELTMIGSVNESVCEQASN